MHEHIQTSTKVYNTHKYVYIIMDSFLSHLFNVFLITYYQRENKASLQSAAYQKKLGYLLSFCQPIIYQKYAAHQNKTQTLKAAAGIVPSLSLLNLMHSLPNRLMHAVLCNAVLV